MKSLVKTVIFLLMMLNSSCLTQKPLLAQGGNVSMQIFYDQLSPYGQWVNNQEYGYVWFPDVSPDFAPYSTEGHWIMTDFGWTWISDYEWGWAPFHYGRWDFDNNYGWFWVPDYEWGPSWVTWRRGNGYYGWAPMRPGVTISLSFGGGYGNADRWYFVRDRDFDRPDLGRYYVNRRDNDEIIRSSTVINNTYVDNSRRVTYITGPQANDVQSATGRRINRVAIHDNDKPVQKLNNNQLELYRPQVERVSEARQKPAPVRITDTKDIRQQNRRNNDQQAQPQQPQPQPQPQPQQRRVEDIRQSQPQPQPQPQQQQRRVEDTRQPQKNEEVQPKLPPAVREQKQPQNESGKQVQPQPQPGQNQQGQTVQPKNKQDNTSPARNKRIDRQRKKANPPEKKVNSDQGNKENKQKE
jgi:hypothetical protein